MRAIMHVGKVGACWWIYMEGTVSPADHLWLMGTFKQIGEAMTPVGVLHLAHETNRPSAQERKELAAAIQNFQNPHNVRGYALVTNSTIVRSAVTAINWLIKTPVNQKVFGRPSDALQWLVGLNIGIDGPEVDAAMAAAEPRYRTLRW